jgi:hypothetical protein
VNSKRGFLQGFRLLGIPAGSQTSVTEFINEKLEDMQQQTQTIHQAITNPQTLFKIFMECTIQKLPHLLQTDVLYNYNPNETNKNFTHWDGPLTNAINKIISNFLKTTFNTDTLPHHSLQTAQLDITHGGLGMWDPGARAIPDFVLNFTKTWRSATKGISTHKRLPPLQLHTSIRNLFTIDNNPNSIILKQSHSLLPNMASILNPKT